MTMIFSASSSAVAGVASLRTGPAGRNRQRQRVDVEGSLRRLQDLPERRLPGHHWQSPS